MVRMVAPSACSAGTRQLFTRTPSSSMEQAPHSPSPQPSLVPVRPGCSRRTSSRRAMGKVSSVNGWPLMTQCNWILRAASGMRGLQEFQEFFRRDGNLADVRAGGVGDGVGDGGSGAVEGEFADAFGAGGTARVRHFFEKNMDGRNVHGGGHDVVGHLTIDHAAFLPDDIFIKSETDALGDAAFDLSGGEDGIDDFTDFLDGDEIFDADFGGAGIDGNFGDVDGPGIGAVGVALIFRVVPMKIGGMLILGEGLQRAEFLEVLRASSCKIFFGIGVTQKAAVYERFLDGEGGGFDEFSDDHSGAGGDGGAAVGDERSVGLEDFDLTAAEVESFGGDLREDGVGALAHLGAAGEDADFSFAGYVHEGFGGEIFFAGTGETGAVEEGGEADAAFDGVAGIFLGEAGAFFVIGAHFQSAGQ